MTLTVYCHAQIECDAYPCSAPYEKRDSSPVLTTEAVERTRAKALRAVQRQAREEKWHQAKGKWLCPYEPPLSALFLEGGV